MPDIELVGWPHSSTNPTQAQAAPQTIRIPDIDAVLYDKDGTLVDYHAMWSAWLIAYRDRLKHHALQSGIEPGAFPRVADMFHRLIGWDETTRRARPGSCLSMAPTRYMVTMAAGSLHAEGLRWIPSRDAAQAALADVDETFDWQAMTVPVSGVIPAVRGMYERGLNIAVVTADTTERARGVVKLLGLDDVVSCIIGEEKDSNLASKPAPDMVLEACRRLGVRPERAIVIGDTVVDGMMGRAAGAAATVGVLSGAGDRTELTEAFDYIVESAANVRPA